MKSPSNTKKNARKYAYNNCINEFPKSLPKCTNGLCRLQAIFTLQHCDTHRFHSCGLVK